MKKTFKNAKGITLVALVITVIILLILAGISISALTNQGIFGKAQEAKQKSKNAQKEESEILENYLAQMNAISFKNVDKTKTNPEAAIPKGAVVIEGDANKGIVIKDSKDNEWVWVEVPMSITAGKATDSDIETALQTYVGDYREGSAGQNFNWIDEYYDGCGMIETEYNAAKSKMLQSIKENGGFWISRYEAGIKGSDTDTTKARLSHPDDVITDETISIFPEAVSQANMIPYNYVNCSESQTLAKRMSTDTTKTTSLLFGIQWDLTCKFLQEKGELSVAQIKGGDDIGSTNWGNYSNSQITNLNGKYAILNKDKWELGTWSQITSDYIKPNTDTNKDNLVLLTTGASEQTNKMNIYDFAGNEWEWTLEHATSNTNASCAHRGGGYYINGSVCSASSRSYNRYTTYSDNIVGFRSTLY